MRLVRLWAFGLGVLVWFALGVGLGECWFSVVMTWGNGGKLVDRWTWTFCLRFRVDFAQKRLAFNRGTPLSSSLSLSLSLSLSIYIDICIIYNIYLVQDRSSSV